MKFLWIITLIFVLLGCGVDTSSSQGIGTRTDINTSTDTNTSIDTNTSTDTNTSVDTNTSTGTDGGTGTGTDTGTVVTDPIFDTSNLAEYDVNACRSIYATAIPLQDHNENDDRESDDDANGISVQSLYRETGSIVDSNVIVFYKKITAISAVGDVVNRKTIYGDNSNFIVSYDLLWLNEPNNTIYVQTPKNGKDLASCFRATLSSESVIFEQVYR